MVILLDEAITSLVCQTISHYNSLLVKGPVVPTTCDCGCGEPELGGAYEEFGRNLPTAEAEFHRREQELLRSES